MSSASKNAENKSPLIFIHGFRGAPLGLQELASQFPNYTVHIPAIPPFAGAPTLAAYTPEAYAAYIADFIKQKRLKKPVLIGHSMGSIIAAATAEKYPTLINSKLILLSPISVQPAKFFSWLQPLVTILPNRLIGWVSTLYLFVPRHQRHLYRQTLRTTYACGQKLNSSRDILAATQFSTTFSVASFDTTKQNLLFIAGAKDRLVPPAKTKQVAKQLKATAKFIPHAGHLLNYERPHQTARLIQDFLKT